MKLVKDLEMKWKKKRFLSSPLKQRHWEREEALDLGIDKPRRGKRETRNGGDSEILVASVETEMGLEMIGIAVMPLRLDFGKKIRIRKGK